MIRKKCDFFAAYSVKISNTSCAVSSPHVPLPPPTLAEDHLIDEERDPMRPAIITHTAYRLFNSPGDYKSRGNGTARLVFGGPERP